MAKPEGFSRLCSNWQPRRMRPCEIVIEARARGKQPARRNSVAPVKGETLNGREAGVVGGSHQHAGCWVLRSERHSWPKTANRLAQPRGGNPHRLLRVGTNAVECPRRRRRQVVNSNRRGATSRPVPTADVRRRMDRASTFSASSRRRLQTVASSSSW
jgi:hypothetical protein